MSDELLSYYNRELSYIRRQAGRFAESHPKVAARLRLGPDGSEDPHVERLLEGFAYLTARVRHKIDDEFPEVTEALLGVLYPHYLAPIPSFAIVQLDLDEGQNELTAGLTVPRGQGIETDPVQGDPIRFRTAYPVTLFPVDVRSASLVTAPFTAPVTPKSNVAQAVLRLSLTCRSSAMKWSALNCKKLRLFLNGQPQHTQKLYELIFNNALEVAFATKPDDRNAVVAETGVLKPVGFDREDGLLPYPARSFTGYRLLTELFAFPQKFLFVDIDIPPAALARTDNNFEVFIYLNRPADDLAANVNAESFRFGCTPMVNLYSQPAEPIRLTQTQFEYRVVPDARRPLSHEVYAIERVAATAPDGREVEYAPFFSVKHGTMGRVAGPYWHSTRRPAQDLTASRPDVAVDRGTEVFLSFVDLGFNPTAPADWTVHVEATCLSRDLPGRLPFGGGQPKLQMAQGGGLVNRLRCLTPPTATLRTHLQEEGLWRLVSHLTLNHLSVAGGPDAADALREILSLYDFTESAVAKTSIEGLLSVNSRRVLGRAGGALCRGVEVNVEFDEDRFTGNGMFLFASVLERFLSLYSSVNSFTRMVATVARREGEYRRWPARVGEAIVL